MSGDFTVSGGRSSRVATEEMSRYSAQLRGFAETAIGVRARLGVLNATVSVPVINALNAPVSALNAHESVDDCFALLWFASLKAQMLAGTVDAAADAYGTVDRIAQGLMQSLMAEAARALGRVSPLLITGAIPSILMGAGLWLLTPEERRHAAFSWLEGKTAIISDPRVVDFVRLSVSSVDDFGGGLAGVPRVVMALFGDEALGILGFSTAAGILTGTVRTAGLLRETPVAVETRGAAVAVAPVTGFGDRAKRIPEGKGQVVIERYEVPGQPDRFEIYIGGTRDGSLVTGSEPWDNTSNLTSMASESLLAVGDSGSSRAVAAAMLKAGIGPENPVQITGYSQGAMVGLEIANSGLFTVESVFTVGGPTGELPVPDSTSYLALEHEEDLLVAGGGVRRDPDTVVVQRALFENGEVPSTSVLPAHELGRYRESAQLLDSAHDPRVVQMAREMSDFAAGATNVESQLWIGRRVAAEQ